MGGFALGALITALLTVNNIRDIDADRTAGRRTIPVVFGRNGGLLEYSLCLVLAYLTPFYIFAIYRQNIWYLLPLLTVPGAIRLTLFIKRNTGRSLNQALAGTAMLVLWFGVFMALGIVLA
jgi:1,4-dihydroxy-2-naphthoate octaprenyltransferase